MIMQELYWEFIQSRKKRGFSPKTVEGYECFLAPFVSFVGCDIDMMDLTDSVIDDYILAVYRKPVARATHATYLRHLKAFIHWGIAEYGLSLSFSKIKVPKVNIKMLRIYSDDEIVLIFRSITAESPWLTARNRAMVALMLDSGLRRGELCTLLCKDVRFDTRIVKVCGKGNKERIVPLGKLAAYYVQDYLRQCPYRSSYLFVGRWGQPVTGNTVKQLISKLAHQLPFEFSSHKLRHNFATNYCLDQYEQTGQVDIYRLMVLMGHEDIETTRRYLHFANQVIAARTSISHMDRLLGVLTDPPR